ncbi:hypothetical protein GWI33_000928 [Rhynchophorus ferrugineus]|uniref:Uncharacterized protein n=1 Tax=Rhynchophorus ferrugineus TaxID=354439 RepID=A0A834HMC8_RHYFE|nr:hypothetical protein GWI33_000929 [Rhynchophorus ferrugineus]KAF7263900.1 hypothetical protein GWI33_000928 [Rhynchophorus ferrugineus]
MFSKNDHLHTKGGVPARHNETIKLYKASLLRFPCSNMRENYAEALLEGAEPGGGRRREGGTNFVSRIPRALLCQIMDSRRGLGYLVLKPFSSV